MQTLYIKRDPQKSWLLWWSPDMRKWYPINSRNVKPMPEGNRQDPFEAFRGYRETMNRVYAGCIEAFLGDYDGVKGVLKLKALTAAAAMPLTVSNCRRPKP